MGAEAIIRIKEIEKNFGNKNVLKNLSLEIRKGEIFGLVGKSGCGKSTLLKILMGIYPPDDGTVEISGLHLAKNLYKIRKTVGYTTQENSFYEKLTIYENMQYYANLYCVSKKEMGKPVKTHLEEILQSVDLFKHRNLIAGRISGGMKRRLDFAISLVHNPSILILDEPTTGLDPLLVRQFWEVVLKNKTDERTVIICTHIFSEIEENCDRVGIMNKGEIVKIVTIPKDDVAFKLFPIFKKIIANPHDQEYTI